jgi:hypothetical protein
MLNNKPFDDSMLYNVYSARLSLYMNENYEDESILSKILG